MSKTPTISVAVLLLCGVLAGCSRTIGDACVQNVDCSLAGDRFCDIASPGGYCTIEGCDWNTCPDGAACVRFFNLLRGAPACEPSGTGARCQPNEQCLCEKWNADARACDRSCEDPKADPATCKRHDSYCASETSERRWCMRRCDDDGDCRDGYGCYTTGENGALTVPRLGVSTVDEIRFCAPRAQF
jgi:hypothetical protein